MELLTRATFEKRRDARENELFLSAFADGEGGGRRRGEGRGEMLLSFSTELQGAMHASNKPPFKRDTEERETGVLIAPFHACIIRLHASNGGIISYKGARIFLYSLLDNKEIRLWIIDIAFDRKSEEFLIFRSGLRAMNRSKFSKKKVSEIFSTKKIDIKRD